MYVNHVGLQQFTARTVAIFDLPLTRISDSLVICPILFLNPENDAVLEYLLQAINLLRRSHNFMRVCFNHLRNNSGTIIKTKS